MRIQANSRRLSQLRDAKPAELKKMITVADYAKSKNILVQSVYARIDAKTITAVKKWNVIFIVPT